MSWNPVLVKAYEIIFGKPPEMPDWWTAEKLMEHFDVPKLGERLAAQCLFEIVDGIHYPDRESTTRIVGRAEGFLSEIFPELNQEPHMSEIGRMRYYILVEGLL